MNALKYRWLPLVAALISATPALTQSTSTDNP